MTPQSDYDSPWKDVLDLFFEAFMSFFFPQAHAQIDWARGFEFLDKELQKITADAAIGRRVVDKLVKVWLRTGRELWVLIHIEVQGQRETDFELRVYVYHYRIFDRFGVPVATFVILADEDENWRPSEYQTELLGTELWFKFPAAKVTDYRERWDELDRNDTPFAVVVQALLIAQQTKSDAHARFQEKLKITKRLYERGFDEKQIIGLFRFIDWVLTLPLEMDEEYKRKLSEYEEEKKMKYVTSIERIGIEKGIEKGILKGGASITLLQLQNLFGVLDPTVQSHILALPLERIQELGVALLNFESLSDLEAWLAQHPLRPIPSGASETAGGIVLQP